MLRSTNSVLGDERLGGSLGDSHGGRGGEVAAASTADAGRCIRALGEDGCGRVRGEGGDGVALLEDDGGAGDPEGVC